MATIQLLPRPTASGKVPLVAWRTRLAPVMGPADPGTATPLMGPANPGTTAPLMGRKEAR